MTLIAGIRTADGIILCADSEEVIPEALRTTAEKIRNLYNSQSDWHILAAGAGDVDYIRMVGDLIQEKVVARGGTRNEITRAIRETVHEVWKNHIHFEQTTVNVQMLLASWSHDATSGFTVINNAAVREGRQLETFGIGDATFRALADRYLSRGLLSVVGGDVEAVRIFCIFAMQRAKQTIPGVGGSTRIVTLLPDGTAKWEKSWKVSAIQNFFSDFDDEIQNLLTHGAVSPEQLASTMGKRTVREIRKLRKEIARIEHDPRLI